MAINPTGPISTPILTYATPAQRKAVGQENEEDKARPLPPVEEGQQSEASANRRRDPSRIEDELPDDGPTPRKHAPQARKDVDALDEQQEPSDGQTSVRNVAHSMADIPYQSAVPIGIDDLLDLAAKGLQYKDSDGEK
ncbi:MAG TPA: hypothetical protein VLA24_00990 [Pseudomonadales bacterium]|nr:hypothetical protein [Pseudomonadales bacterium]